MSKQLLYHGLGVRGYDYVRAVYQKGEIDLVIEQDPSDWRCPGCGSADVIGRGYEVRRLRTLPLGRKSVFIVLSAQRVECKCCSTLRQVNIPFARGRVRYTRAFEHYALDLSRCTTIQDAARHLGVSWDTVKDIQRRYLNRRFAKPKLKHLRRIAIDEIAVAKGHKYLTVVLDLESGVVVYVGQGRSADALDAFWRRLRASHAKVTAVAMDMSAAYILAVRQNLKNAVIVFDHFHLIQLYNQKLSDLRRDVQREAEGPLQKKVLKGTRWLLLKSPENLDPKHNERKRLDEALRLNQPLATAYYMKEDLRQIWMQKDKQAAEAFLDDWIARAQTSGIRMLHAFAITVATYRHGILAWYDHPITTAKLEGTNNKIKVLKRMAYGFRDHTFFILKIYGIHETKYALVG